MSTEVTTEMMNEVIGVFMGYKMYDKRYPRNHGIGAPEAEPEKCMIIQKAKYHTSWDWLMEAWRKLRSSIWERFNEYPSDFCSISDAWEQYCFIVDIVGAHDVLYKAIQWHNQHKQTNDERGTNKG